MKTMRDIQVSDFHIAGRGDVEDPALVIATDGDAIDAMNRRRAGDVEFFVHDELAAGEGDRADHFEVDRVAVRRDRNGPAQRAETVIGQIGNEQRRRRSADGGARQQCGEGERESKCFHDVGR